MIYDECEWKKILSFLLEQIHRMTKFQAKCVEVFAPAKYIVITEKTVPGNIVEMSRLTPTYESLVGFILNNSTVYHVNCKPQIGSNVLEVLIQMDLLKEL